MSLRIFDEVEDIKKIIADVEIKTKSELRSQQERTDKVEALEKKLENILRDYSERIVFINVGGKLFNTKLSTLVSVKDNLFYNLLINHEDLILNSKDKPLFIDRDFTYFPVILDYLKYGKFKIPDQKLTSEYKEEFDFYNMYEALEKKKSISNRIDFTFQSNNPVLPECTINELRADIEKVGVTCGEESEIIFTLDSTYNLKKIIMRGITGMSNWETNSGRKPNIFSSSNMVDWIKVGKIPKNFGKSQAIIHLGDNKTKYIKFETNKDENLGIGFIEFYEKD